MNKKNFATLNAVEVLGEYLKLVGFNQVKIIPSQMIDNDSDTCHIWISYKHYYQLTKLLEDKLRYIEGEK